jgi:hypothetical protein
VNKQESSKIVAVILGSWTTQAGKLDRERVSSMIEAFAANLSDLDYSHVDAALRVLIQTRTWIPSIAEIREQALELVRGPKATGLEAWGSVVKAMREQGSYRTPGTDFVFRDAVTARVVAAMGWQELCASENAVSDRARFVDAYDAMAISERRAQQSPILKLARDHADDAKKLPEAEVDQQEAATLVLRLAAAKKAGGCP